MSDNPYDPVIDALTEALDDDRVSLPALVRVVRNFFEKYSQAAIEDVQQHAGINRSMLALLEATGVETVEEAVEKMQQHRRDLDGQRCICPICSAVIGLAALRLRAQQTICDRLGE